jgi:hypothetical protein
MRVVTHRKRNESVPTSAYGRRSATPAVELVDDD